MRKTESASSPACGFEIKEKIMYGSNTEGFRIYVKLKKENIIISGIKYDVLDTTRGQGHVSCTYIYMVG